MGKCLFMRKGETHTEPVNFNPVFENNTWDAIIKAVQKNKVPVTWEVGDQKSMTINGKDYLIDIIGKNHDTYSDGSGKAPLTFQMHELYASNYAMNSSNTNSGGWTSCAMRTTHLPAIKTLMPTEVRSALKPVKKLSSAGAQSINIITTEDDLFLLSEVEIFGINNFSVSGEGNQYDYYAAGNSKAKTMNGSANSWWTRSPRETTSTDFCNVYTTGVDDASSASGGRGVSFAFCF